MEQQRDHAVLDEVGALLEAHAHDHHEVPGRDSERDGDLRAARPRPQPLGDDGRPDEEHAEGEGGRQQSRPAQRVRQLTGEAKRRVDRRHDGQRAGPEAQLAGGGEGSHRGSVSGLARGTGSHARPEPLDMRTPVLRHSITVSGFARFMPQNLEGPSRTRQTRRIEPCSPDGRPVRENRLSRSGRRPKGRALLPGGRLKRWEPRGEVRFAPRPRSPWVECVPHPAPFPTPAAPAPSRSASDSQAGRFACARLQPPLSPVPHPTVGGVRPAIDNPTSTTRATDAGTGHQQQARPRKEGKQ